MTVSEISPATGTSAGTAPLSAHQRFLCMFDQGEEQGPFGPRYHIAGAWRIAGALDAEALRAALTEVVGRHEALRTEVVRGGPGASQRVLPPMEAALEIHDLSGVPAERRDRAVEELYNAVESGTVDAARFPLLRAVLGRFGDDDAVLVLNAHHTAADAWSMHVILRDLLTYYARRTGHEAPELPEVTQYREFAEWESRRSGESLEKAREFWRENLRGARIHAVRTVHPRSANLPKSSAWQRFTLESEVAALAHEYARTHRSSLFMVLLSAYEVFLYRTYGEADIVVPTFSLGRGQERFMDTVGAFVNFLPLRTDLTGCADFHEVVTRTKKTCLRAFTRDLPFVEIMAQAPELMASVAVDDAQTWVFQVAAAPPGDSVETIAGLRVERVWRRTVSQPVGSDVPDGALWTIHADASGEMAGSLGFNTNRNDEDAMNGVLAEFLHVLHDVLTAPDSPIEGS
ncbi:hypothetical protein CFN78_17230 [Amycolatopsis antarctica]|uniref:Condensation domain-containing protein n=1 Tax=Amycolatopsis antarctica TaxID=1854586 RepID=A0A263D356_9PSEU|nr:condensation domain-containing protein [Amycolatopsis antarctica]OZM71896.1 hypothetical protein CFN78_17230 [Amycolatopsis antarctica]